MELTLKQWQKQQHGQQDTTTERKKHMSGFQAQPILIITLHKFRTNSNLRKAEYQIFHIAASLLFSSCLSSFVLIPFSISSPASFFFLCFNHFPWILLFFLRPLHTAMWCDDALWAHPSLPSWDFFCSQQRFPTECQNYQKGQCLTDSKHAQLDLLYNLWLGRAACHNGLGGWG